MQATTDSITTSTRRSALGFYAAALPDAELIALAADYLSIDDQIYSFDILESEIDEKTLCSKLDQRARLMGPITAISAQTDQGRITKAKVALAVMRMADEIESKVHTELVRSALRDIIAGSASA